MKRGPLQEIADFAEFFFGTFGTMLPLAVVGGSLYAVCYFCAYEHRLESIVVEESEADCRTTDESGRTSSQEEIEVSNHWKCLYLSEGHLKPGTKLEYLEWMRGFRLPFLGCDTILEYKISGEEKIHNPPIY